MAADIRGTKIPKPHHGRGTIPLNRSYKGVGQIRTASGTNDPKTFARLIHAMDSLYEAGNIEALEVLRDKKIAPMKLLSNVTNQGVLGVGDLRTSEPLEASVTLWLQQHGIAEATRKSYGDALKQFYKIVPTVAKVRELPRYLRTYKDQCQSRGIPYTAIVARRILLSYASDQFGKNSELYRQLQDVKPPAAKKKLENEAISVKEVRRLMECLPDYHASIVWHMCLTGLRISEFFETSPTRWIVEKDVITVFGSKTVSANRILFNAGNVQKPTRGEKAFTRALTKAQKDERLKGLGHVTPHTFRKCFALWMARAKIMKMHRGAYMGHSHQSMTELYEGADVSPYIKADCKKFSTYIRNEQRDPDAKRKLTSDKVNEAAT